MIGQQLMHDRVWDGCGRGWTLLENDASMIDDRPGRQGRSQSIIRHRESRCSLSTRVGWLIVYIKVLETY
jgi:hypothetical protein